jgi:DNA-binding NtrC family response regulator
MSPLNLNCLSRILIVDGDNASRARLGLMLSGEGYEVRQADNGEQAAVLFHRCPFDLVITELNLEGKDGIELIKEIRQEKLRTCFIVTIQGGCLPADFCGQMAERFGVNSIFPKPFPPEQMLSAVRRTLGPARVSPADPLS